MHEQGFFRLGSVGQSAGYVGRGCAVTSVRACARDRMGACVPPAA